MGPNQKIAAHSSDQGGKTDGGKNTKTICLRVTNKQSKKIKIKI